MKRILFVDDEASVLEGLENRLRRFRKDWHLEFALGGKPALEKLAQNHFDVIVTDMRMPGMDGAELLTQVRTNYGHIVRIVLTGQTEKDRMLKALCVAHQVLNKPSDAQTLRDTIDHICELQSRLSNPVICNAINSVSELPSLPKMYIALTELVNQDDFSLADVMAIIENDPSMVTRILQVVNSTFYGLGRTVTSTNEAVSLLGINTLRCIVLTVELFSALKDGQSDGAFSVPDFYRNATQVVRLVKRFVLDSKLQELAVTAALLHDIGRLFIATTLPEKYHATHELAVQKNITEVEAERELYGFTHADVGGYLLSLWNIPFPIVEVVTHHHQPSRSLLGELEVCSAVHAATNLVNILDPLLNGDQHPSIEVEDLLNRLRASTDFENEFFSQTYTRVDLKSWCAMALEELGHARG